MKNGKYLLIGALYIVLMIAIPASFAADNNTTNSPITTNDTTTIPVTTDSINQDSGSIVDDNSTFDGFDIYDNATTTDDNGEPILYDSGLVTNDNDTFNYFDIYTNNSSEVDDNGEPLVYDVSPIVEDNSTFDGFDVYNNVSNITDENGEPILYQEHTVNPKSLSHKNVILNTSHFTKNYGDNKTFTGNISKVANSTSTVSLNITRLSDGKSKVYNATITNGTFNLPINLSPGAYLVKTDLKTKYVNFTKVFTTENVNHILVSNSSLNKTQTYLVYDYKYLNGLNGHKFNGILKTYSGKYLANKVVSIHVTNKATGLTKVYKVTTNKNGRFTLPVNLVKNGHYSINCIYSGTNFYSGSNLAYSV